MVVRDGFRTEIELSGDIPRAFALADELSALPDAGGNGELHADEYLRDFAGSRRKLHDHGDVYSQVRRGDTGTRATE